MKILLLKISNFMTIHSLIAVLEQESNRVKTINTSEVFHRIIIYTIQMLLASRSSIMQTITSINKFLLLQFLLLFKLITPLVVFFSTPNYTRITKLLPKLWLYKRALKLECNKFLTQKGELLKAATMKIINL